MSNTNNVTKSKGVKTCGVYKLTNIINGKYYIGQSNNCYYRIYTHFKKLSSDKHHNPDLQSDFNEFGRFNFKTQVIEKCNESELNEREVHWLNHFKSITNIEPYNKSNAVHNRKRKIVVSDEIKQKLAKISKEWLDNNKPSHVPCSQEEWVENRSKGLYYREGEWGDFKQIQSRGLKIHKRRLYAVNIETREVKEYESAAACGKAIGVYDSTVLKCIHKYCKNYSNGNKSEERVLWQVKGHRIFEDRNTAEIFAKSGIKENPTPNNGKSKISEIIIKNDQETKTFSSFESLGKFIGVDRSTARNKVLKNSIQGWQVVSNKRMK